MADRSVKVILSATDRMSAPLNKITNTIKKTTEAFDRMNKTTSGGPGGGSGPGKGIVAITNGLTNVAIAAERTAGRVKLATIAMSAMGAAFVTTALGGATLLARKVIGVSAEFEKYSTTLEIVMKDSARAASSMEWISKFAAKTPFELAETTAAFVKLTTYGIDPMKGTLESAGNAAAAMGKPLNQAVEAIADAMTGEVERLKEFGITARQEGGKVTYNWLENGKLMVATAQKSSRAQQLAVINGIWNRQYAGAMDKLSQTWNGIMSNLKDAYSRFLLAIGKSGVFDYMKGKAQALLDYVNKLAEDGTLDRWAKRIGATMIAIFERVEKFVKAIDWEALYKKMERMLEIGSKIADFFGGPLNAALIAIGAITFGPLILSVTLLATSLLPLLLKSFTALNLVMNMTPIGRILGLLMRLAQVALLVWANWDTFKKVWTRVWDAAKEKFYSFWDGVPKKVEETWKKVTDWLGNFDMIEVGKNMINKLWEGMKAGWEDLKEGLQKAIRKLWADPAGTAAGTDPATDTGGGGTGPRASTSRLLGRSTGANATVPGASGTGTQVAQPGASGTYRPKYKLTDADLSPEVIRTIAGEARMSDPSSIDAVINNMMNRLGSKGWGPSGNLREVAGAPGQYAGFNKGRPSEKQAQYIRDRIKAIAEGQVPDNTGGANTFRTNGYGFGGGSQWFNTIGKNGTVVGGNRFAYNPKIPNGPYAPFTKPNTGTASIARAANRGGMSFRSDATIPGAVAGEGPSPFRFTKAAEGGASAIKSAGEAKSIPGASITYQPHIEVKVDDGKNVAKKVEETVRGHNDTLAQRQREALHD